MAVNKSWKSPWLPIAITWLCVSACAFVATEVSADDICRQEFVACVSQTGSPLECQSAYLNCTAQGLATDPNPDVVAETSLQVEEDYSLVQLTVTNTSSDIVDVGNMSVDLICQDGREETAYFTFRPGLSSGDSLISMTQRVCIGSSPARMASNSRGTDLSNSRSAMQFQCPGETSSSVSISWIGTTAVRAVKGNTVYTFNTASDATEAIIEQICASSEQTNTSALLELRGLLRDFLGARPVSEKQTSTIGVRG